MNLVVQFGYCPRYGKKNLKGKFKQHWYNQRFFLKRKLSWRFFSQSKFKCTTWLLSLGFLRSTLFDGQTRPIEGFGFDEIDRLVDSRRRLVVVMVMIGMVVTSFGTFRRLERRVRFQIQIEILNFVQLVTGADDLVTLEEVVNLFNRRR